MNIREFQRNRARIPADELREYRGQWVAFSPDGARIVANSRDLAKLDELLVAAGHDPEQMPLERIVDQDDCFLGAGEIEG